MQMHYSQSVFQYRDSFLKIRQNTVDVKVDNKWLLMYIYYDQICAFKSAYTVAHFNKIDRNLSDDIYDVNCKIDGIVKVRPYLQRHI